MSAKSALVTLVKAVVPKPVRAWVYATRFAAREWALRRQTPEQVFTDIYERNAWGGDAGSYCSGKGSSIGTIVDPYVAVVGRLADERGFRGLVFVDIGCGDFSVGRRLAPLASRYVGADVVGPLVERNQREFGDERTSFVKLDATRDELPPGDVCFLRQVLQHLGNDQISRILPKLRRYRWVFVTEHHPSPNPQIVPNVDKVHGGHIRLYSNSGVFLDQPPFSLPAESLELVLELPSTGLESAVDPGVIRTILYTPGK